MIQANKNKILVNFFIIMQSKIYVGVNIWVHGTRTIVPINYYHQSCNFVASRSILHLQISFQLTHLKISLEFVLNINHHRHQKIKKYKILVATKKKSIQCE